MLGLLPLYPSGTIIAAAPEGCPRGGSVTKNSKKTLYPQCLGEALMRGPSNIFRFSYFGCEPNRFMSGSPELFLLLFMTKGMVI